MKKLRLREWVKVVLIIILFLGTFLLFFKIGSDRVEKINNGTMIVIDHNAGDR